MPFGRALQPSYWPVWEHWHLNVFQRACLVYIICHFSDIVLVFVYCPLMYWWYSTKEAKKNFTKNYLDYCTFKMTMILSVKSVHLRKMALNEKHMLSKCEEYFEWHRGIPVITFISKHLKDRKQIQLREELQRHWHEFQERR